MHWKILINSRKDLANWGPYIWSFHVIITMIEHVSQLVEVVVVVLKHVPKLEHVSSKPLETT
jgi:hypothetical protein